MTVKFDDRIPKFLTQTEVCERLRISRKTLQRYRQLGRIPFFNFGHRTVRIRESDIERFELRASQ